jgi:hypothetical protein
MALIPVALAVVGGMQQGNAQDAAAQSAASDMRINAGYAKEAANDALSRGRYDADLQRIRTGQAIGTQRAAMAANGGLVNEGSNAQLQEDTAALGELDALTIQNNAAREAYGLKVQAISGYSNANKTALAGQQAKQNSLMGGIVKGAGSFFGGGGMSMFGGGQGAGTTAAYGGSSSLLNNNQAYA